LAKFKKARGGARMQYDPERDYLQGPSNSLGYEEEKGSTLARLVWLGIGLALLILFIPLLDFAIQNPEVRWSFLLVILLICGAFLFFKTYPKMGYRSLPEIAPVTSKNEPGAAERELTMIANAIQGAPYSQMLSYLELREMLVRRFMLLHHLPRAEAEYLLADPKSNKRFIKDTQLIWLLTYDFKSAYEPNWLKTQHGQTMVKDFDQVFPRLLKKLEALK
jgi:hypothetical protein